MARYRFALRPRWVLLHLLVVLLVVVMVNLGFWQLRRLDERRASNQQVESRTTASPVPVQQVAPSNVSGDALASLRFRLVSTAGVYDAAGSTVVAARTQDGRAGGWLVSPMQVGPETFLVLRGFVGLQDDGSLPSPPAPTGTVTLTGYTLAISGFDPIARRDLEALHDKYPAAPPVVVQVATSDPAEAQLVVIPLPELGDGPHLGYAVQWFLFSTIAVGGYFIVVRRSAQQRAREAHADDAA
jgi:surfeit locus 1 family protein